MEMGAMEMGAGCGGALLRPSGVLGWLVREDALERGISVSTLRARGVPRGGCGAVR